MSTKQQLREEVASRLGFSSQQGSDLIQAPLLNSFLERAQDEILRTYGSVLATVWPAVSFSTDSDEPSVPEEPLLMKAMISAKTHYRQPPDAEVAAWDRYDKNVRGYAA